MMEGTDEDAPLGRPAFEQQSAQCEFFKIFDKIFLYDKTGHHEKKNARTVALSMKKCSAGQGGRHWRTRFDANHIAS